MTFLDYVRQRRTILLRRAAGEAPPWTRDQVLLQHKFCCVSRDDDRTSVLARQLIMSLPSAQRLGAVLGFRLYNRVETLEALCAAGCLERGEGVEQVILALDHALNTSAYKISVPGGLFNKRSVSAMVRRAVRAARDFAPRPRAELTCAAVKGAVGCGSFLAYQVTLDLRWLRGPYQDEQDWCLLGLGAVRGLARLAGLYQPQHWKTKQQGDEEGYYARSMGINLRAQEKGDLGLPPRAREQMIPLLGQLRQVLPQASMMDLEHNLCEWDKYERIKNGEGVGRHWQPRLLP
jgi:alpha-glutamyl/putrescinyl thymine pyrophosphorylase clade 1